MTTKLNQVIAIEKGIKSREHAEVSRLYKLVQRPAVFDGLIKEYKPKDENGETYPTERQRVQETVSNVLKTLSQNKAELFDVTAQKDFANMYAKADVVVNGETIVPNAPVPFLLFLEKQLTDLRTLVTALPVLDEAEDWTADLNSGLYKTGITARNSTKKVQKPLVLYPATDKHPAQTQLITEDVTVGVWEQVKQSGAMPKPERDALLDRVETLLNAVKFARESANDTEAPRVNVGASIFGFLLG